jgi:predicted O-methyltransferase YrrM
MSVDDVIQEMENQPHTHPTSVNIEAAEFFYALTRALKPELIVEIGCYIGFSTIHFAKALKENGSGRIISIDLFRAHPDFNIPDPLELATSYRQKAGLDELITYVKGYSAEVRQDLESEISDRIDLLFIDGNHEVEGVYHDFNAYYKDLKVGGYIILHDIYPEKCGWDSDGPRVLLNYLKSKRFIPKYLEKIEMPTENGFGIALLHKVHRHNIRVRTGISLTSIRWMFEKFYRMPSRVCVTVRDSVTGSPIPDALVKCENLKADRKSDEEGHVVVHNTPPGEYLLDITAEGYDEVRGYELKVVRHKKSIDVFVDLTRKS